MLDGAEDYLDRLTRILCAPNGELTRKDRALAAQISYLAGQLRQPLAAALERFQPSERLAVPLPRGVRFKELWVHDASTAALALTTDGRLFERPGKSGSWVCTAQQGSSEDLRRRRRQQRPGFWRCRPSQYLRRLDEYEEAHDL